MLSISHSDAPSFYTCLQFDSLVTGVDPCFFLEVDIQKVYRSLNKNINHLFSTDLDTL